MNIIRVDENTVKLVDETIVDLRELKQQVIDLTEMANNITFIELTNISEEVDGLIRLENAKRQEIKSHLLEQARIKQEELENYG